jgi:predicted Zn-dependent protease
LRLQKSHIDNQGFKNFFERMKESSSVPALLSDHPSDQNRSQMAEKFKNENTTPIMTAKEWKSFQSYCR